MLKVDSCSYNESIQAVKLLLLNLLFNFVLEQPYESPLCAFFKLVQSRPSVAPRSHAFCRRAGRQRTVSGLNGRVGFRLRESESQYSTKTSQPGGHSSPVVLIHVKCGPSQTRSEYSNTRVIPPRKQAKRVFSTYQLSFTTSSKITSPCN